LHPRQVTFFEKKRDSETIIFVFYIFSSNFAHEISLLSMEKEFDSSTARLPKQELIAKTFMGLEPVLARELT
jgi:hypothetical protein